MKEINLILNNLQILLLGFSVGIIFGMYISKKSIDKFFKNKQN